MSFELKGRGTLNQPMGYTTTWLGGHFPSIWEGHSQGNMEVRRPFPGKRWVQRSFLGEQVDGKTIPREHIGRQAIPEGAGG